MREPAKFVEANPVREVDRAFLWRLVDLKQATTEALAATLMSRPDLSPAMPLPIAMPGWS
jgi:hypothetical protein